jgi:hypothetical protein
MMLWPRHSDEIGLYSADEKMSIDHCDNECWASAAAMSPRCRKSDDWLSHCEDGRSDPMILPGVDAIHCWNGKVTAGRRHS